MINMTLIGLYWVSVVAFYGTILHFMYLTSPFHVKVLIMLFAIQKLSRYTFMANVKALVKNHLQNQGVKK